MSQLLHYFECINKYLIAYILMSISLTTAESMSKISLKSMNTLNYYDLANIFLQILF